MNNFDAVAFVLDGKRLWRRAVWGMHPQQWHPSNPMRSGLNVVAFIYCLCGCDAYAIAFYACGEIGFW